MAGLSHSCSFRKGSPLPLPMPADDAAAGAAGARAGGATAGMRSRWHGKCWRTAWVTERRVGAPCNAVHAPCCQSKSTQAGAHSGPQSPPPRRRSVAQGGLAGALDEGTRVVAAPPLAQRLGAGRAHPLQNKQAQPGRILQGRSKGDSECKPRKAERAGLPRRGAAHGRALRPKARGSPAQACMHARTHACCAASKQTHSRA